MHVRPGGGPRVVVSTAAFHARVRGSVPGLGGLKETKMFLPHPRVNVSIAGSLRDREVACSASDRQGTNFESCVWRTVSSQSSHHPQEVLLAQFSLYVHKGGLKPDSFHFHFARPPVRLIYRPSYYNLQQTLHSGNYDDTLINFIFDLSMNLMSMIFCSVFFSSTRTFKLNLCPMDIYWMLYLKTARPNHPFIWIPMLWVYGH